MSYLFSTAFSIDTAINLAAGWPKERLHLTGQRLGLFHGSEVAAPRHRRPAHCLFLLERQLAQSGRYALVVPVFDGSGLYNVRFTDIKPETLSADDYQNFTGPTRLCEVSREEIRVDLDGDTYRRGRIWYARLTASDLMLPVRMEFDTAFGTVKGYLAELSERGVHLRLVPE